MRWLRLVERLPRKWLYVYLGQIATLVGIGLLAAVYHLIGKIPTWFGWTVTVVFLVVGAAFTMAGCYCAVKELLEELRRGI